MEEINKFEILCISPAIIFLSEVSLVFSSKILMSIHIFSKKKGPERELKSNPDPVTLTSLDQFTFECREDRKGKQSLFFSSSPGNLSKKVRHPKRGYFCASPPELERDWTRKDAPPGFVRKESMFFPLHPPYSFQDWASF